MPDVEKVIKGLMVCFTRISCKGKGCPYESEYERSRLCQAHLRDDAIAQLKAQKPVEPVPAIDNDGDWLCGNCYQSVVGEEELDASGFVPVKFNFCPNCGRAVKWDG